MLRWTGYVGSIATEDQAMKHIRVSSKNLPAPAAFCGLCRKVHQLQGQELVEAHNACRDKGKCTGIVLMP